MTQQAWCPTCATVDHVDERWRCLWCGTVALSTLISGEARESRILTRAQLLEAHDRYARGENLGDLSRDLYTGRGTLKQNFWHAGLPTRSVAVSNALEAPRRPVSKLHGELNAAYRRDLTDAAVVHAYQHTGTLRAAAEHLGCGIATVHRRLALAGHPRGSVGKPASLKQAQVETA